MAAACIADAALRDVLRHILRCAAAFSCAEAAYTALVDGRFRCRPVLHVLSPSKPVRCSLGGCSPCWTPVLCWAEIRSIFKQNSPCHTTIRCSGCTSACHLHFRLRIELHFNLMQFLVTLRLFYPLLPLLLLRLQLLLCLLTAGFTSYSSLARHTPNLCCRQTTAQLSQCTSLLLHHLRRSSLTSQPQSLHAAWSVCLFAMAISYMLRTVPHHRRLSRTDEQCLRRKRFNPSMH